MAADEDCGSPEAAVAGRLQGFLVAAGRVDRAAPGIDAPLLDGDALDSFGLLDLVVFLEEEFGVDVEASDVVGENFGSLHAVARFVHRKLAGRSLP